MLPVQPALMELPGLPVPRARLVLLELPGLPVPQVRLALLELLGLPVPRGLLLPLLP